MSKALEVKEMLFSPEEEALIKDEIGFSVQDSFSYVPKNYRKTNEDNTFKISKEKWPVFTLQSKDGIENAKMEDESGYVTVDKEEKSKLHMQSGKGRINVLENGIKKIKNFPIKENGKYKILSLHVASKTATIVDSTGKKTEITKSIKDTIRYMSTTLQIELQNAINERKILSETEKMGLE